MQIPKFFLVLNAVVLVVVPTTIHAAQIKSSRVLAAAPASQNPPMLLAAAGAESTAVAGSTDSEAAARQREALRKALAAPAPESVPAPKAPKASPAPPAPVAAEQPAEPAAKSFKPFKTGKKAEPKFSDVPGLTTPSHSPVLSPSGTFSDPVPSAIPATKEGRLYELLRQYKADAITAEDYHAKRAAILAAP